MTVKASPAYKAYLNKYGITQALLANGNIKDSAEIQAGVCLLMALKHSPTGGEVNDPDLSNTSNVSTTLATGGAPCLTDNWGNALFFSRWPIGVNPVGTPAEDPSDPRNPTTRQSRLSDTTWWNTPGEIAFSNAIHITHYANPANQRQTAVNGTRIMTPTIASMGGDGKSGLNLSGQNPVLNVRNSQNTNPGTFYHWSLSKDPMDLANPPTIVLKDPDDNLYNPALP